MIWSNNIDITLTCWRITNFNFLLATAIFVLICFCHPPGLTFLLLLIFLFTWGLEIFHITAFFFNSLHRIEISARYTELNFLHVIVISFQIGVYRLVGLKFQLGRPSWKFNRGWKFPYNQLLNLFFYIRLRMTTQKITILDNIFGKK